MKIYFVSLGCDKNLVDSEHMLALLDGTYEIVNEAEECDIAIVNTCAFIKDAKEESINTILELAELKKKNIKYLVITGCLAERYSDELKKLIPEIDAYIGISGISNILNDINRVLNEKDVLVQFLIYTEEDNNIIIDDITNKNYIFDKELNLAYFKGKTNSETVYRHGCM